MMARDGYLGKIVEAAVMPQKNNEVIYANVYRAATTEFGLWNQLRVDHGKDFFLFMFKRGCALAVGMALFIQTISTCVII